ncbi:hypothetical protein NECAME_16465 [Necator americanus]|uniref:Telomere length regulation protein conserved domain-containing protein n=1 Tax=Necator americanus TaxID=51031 RepID=W2TWA1_NECAM|nr:hypothetical protein NECAME_16465 [Necator americanus]ETN86138.1 hypothetical protein NECAME_16465 [Necator americanus]
MPSSSSCVINTQPIDSDDEEDFEAYDVPESEKNIELASDGEEPERTAPAPSYIRDCLEQLAEKEKYEKFEAAFFAVNGMIRRKAVGFVDIADQLAKKLVFLENNFSTKKFEETRKQCIISCLVMRPELAPKLGEIIFSRNCSFFHRYLILECFLAAAKELSEFQKEPKKIVEVVKKEKEMPSSSSCVINTQPIDSDDEEDFEAYDVPESEKNIELVSDGDEPERTAPAPSYIRDCLEQLAEKEKYEKFEAAFFAVNGMIRRKAVGFVDIADQLAKKLVFLENNFSTKKFEETRKQCIISCLVMRPELAPKLGEIIFSRNCSFFHRYLILECFLAAAKELSEFQKEPKKIVEVVKKEKELSDWRSIVDARIRSHTRRFTTEKKPEFTSPCRFASVATLFFYPLLRTKTEEHLELKGRDSPFLARLLFCASEILQKAASAPTVVRMAGALAELVTPLRFHPDSFIRSSVLFAYFSIAVAVPESVFFEFFGAVVRGWIEWALSCADDVDSAEHQRNLARSVASVLLEKIDGTATVQESNGASNVLYSK